MLSDDEKTIVRRLAEGDLTVKAEAEAIYLNHVGPFVDGGRKSVEMNFLSECFNVSPDRVLRAMYRKKILAQTTLTK